MPPTAWIKQDKSTSCPKKKGSPTSGSEPHRLGGANAHLTTERRKGALSKMKPQWAHLTKEKFPKAKRNLFCEGFEEVVERRAKAITAIKKATTLGGSSSSQQNFRTSNQGTT